MKQLPKIKKLVKSLRDKLKKKKKIYFFFDYDGVLVPLENDPSKTFLPKERRRKLYSLLKQKNTKIALVSGRDLKTLKKLTGIKKKNILMVGSHGLEMSHKGKKGFLFESNKSMMKKVKPKAIKLAESIADGFVENKPHSFTYHVRDKRKKDFVPILCEKVKKLIEHEKFTKDLKVLPGKRMIEILPQGIDKGRAIEKIISKNKNALYVCLGDDVTDIYAFKIAKKYKGISISLNSNLAYKADYYLDSPKEVEDFIDIFLGDLD